MAQASDYDVTFPYGATTAPYSLSSPHKGDDHAMPSGTPVTVNGTLIGLSGVTGQGVTGPHLHIGHYINGGAVNPAGGGFSLPAPVKVYDTSATLKDGNYVRLLAGDGTIWLYDHLSDNTIVKAGQVLAQPQEPGDDDMNRKATRDEVITIYQQALGIEPTEEQIAAQCAANTPLEVMHSIAGDVNAKRDGDKHNLDQNIAAVADLSGKLHNVATVLGVPDDETAIIDEIIKLKKG